ncbi:rod shape-determining protein MreD [Marinilactibacillus psychrotolerans]|uniref:rod shape-determining protein MreD n=1 Tax=Marinilactibacillus psychrotolerans TaxID=191770 RepID=UPI0018683E37|nr:rod shape-determining protein MreD [Marinilactibacillus psychrotolerans]
MSQWKKIVYPLLMLLIALLLDGILVAQLKGLFITNIGMIVPHLTLLVLLILTFYLSFRHIIILALLMGFIYDSYYTGYLGIFMAIFTIVVYVLLQFKNFFQPNLIIYFLLSIIVITISEFFVFGVYRAINITAISTQEFLLERLGATLLFNGIAILIIGYPIDKVIQGVIQKDEIRFKK